MPRLSIAFSAACLAFSLGAACGRGTKANGDAGVAGSGGTTNAAGSGGTTNAAGSGGTTNAAGSGGTTSAAGSGGTTNAAGSGGTTSAAGSGGTTSAAGSGGTTSAAGSGGTTSAGSCNSAGGGTSAPFATAKGSSVLVPSVAIAQVDISDGTGGTSSDPTCSQENRIYTLDLANHRLVWDCDGTTANASSREIGWRCLSDSDYARARTALNQVVVTGEGRCRYDWNGPETSLTLKSPTGYWIYGDETTCGTAVDPSRLSQFADIVVALHNDAQPADGCVAGGSKGTDAGSGSPSTVNAILLFGGAGRRILGDTWKWDGQRWTELHPAHSPPARMSASMGTLGNRVVLFGGDDRITHIDGDYTYLLGDTWTWDGTDWTRECPAHSPAPRRYGLMKNTNGTLNLFGGTGLLFTNRIDKPGDAIPLDYQDVWTWNGKDWEEQFTPRLPTIYGAPAEALGSQVLLVDSTPGEGKLSADTWVWDGVIWSKRTPALAPPARGGAAVARLGDKVVLFGGYDWDRSTDGLRNDTWTWDGTSWTEQHPSRSPSPRAGAMMATLGDRVILFGGGGDTNLGDTWAWEGTNWTQVATNGPSPRSATVMIGQ